LAAIGGAVGVVLTYWAVAAMNRALPQNLLPVPEITVDGFVLLFAAALVIVTGLLFGLAPSRRSAHVDLHTALKQAGRSSSAALGSRRTAGLAAVGTALATVLLIGAGLLVQTLVHLQQARLGFEPKNLLTFQLAPPTSRYPLADKAPLFYRSLLEALRS